MLIKIDSQFVTLTAHTIKEKENGVTTIERKLKITTKRKGDNYKTKKEKRKGHLS